MFGRPLELFVHPSMGCSTRPDARRVVVIASPRSLIRHHNRANSPTGRDDKPGQREQPEAYESEDQGQLVRRWSKTR